MNEQFRRLVDALQPKLDNLLGMARIPLGRRPVNCPRCGVYLLSEGERHLYVGRSNNMPTRWQNHYKGNHKQAAFAFKLAREETGCTKPTYQKERSRDALMNDPKFLEAFKRAKIRIGKMDLRYVQEDDPVSQCLLEVYVSVALETPYNGWYTT